MICFLLVRVKCFDLRDFSPSFKQKACQEIYILRFVPGSSLSAEVNVAEPRGLHPAHLVLAPRTLLILLVKIDRQIKIYMYIFVYLKKALNMVSADRRHQVLQSGTTLSDCAIYSGFKRVLIIENKSKSEIQLVS